MKKSVSLPIWLGVALLGAFGYWTIATQRAEPVNSGSTVIAALCTYALGYRFYSKWIAAQVLELDDRRATRCKVREDGKDFVKTNKWIVFGHHFAAISTFTRSSPAALRRRPSPAKTTSAPRLPRDVLRIARRHHGNDRRVWRSEQEQHSKGAEQTPGSTGVRASARATRAPWHCPGLKNRPARSAPR